MSNRKGPGFRHFLVAGAMGASLAYFLDPNQGTRRRNMFVDRLLSFMRKTGANASGSVGALGGRAFGVVQETVHLRPYDNPNPDDTTLKDRVESELFREPDIPKGDININVADGIVELRGQLSRPETITTIVERVRGIRNVRGIHNYLHLPNTPAPNKAEVIEVSHEISSSR